MIFLGQRTTDNSQQTLSTDCSLPTFNFQFSLGVPAIAVGLSALSLVAPLSLRLQRMPLQSLTLLENPKILNSRILEF